MDASSALIETDIPARLDRLPWGRFHTYVVVALGITWALDGLEVTLAGAVASALKASPTLRFTNEDVGIAASCYLIGAVTGGLFFGWLTDRLGRRRLFFVTLALYIAAAAATGLAWNFWSFVLFRLLTGAGIGGEYTAINSTIQELIPARFRGRTDLAVNGSFWLGALVGAAGSAPLLDPNLLPGDLGWRFCFLIGAALALVILFMRMWLPESPRWLMLHGDLGAADAVVRDIEHHFPPTDGPPKRLRLHRRGHVTLLDVIEVLFRRYRQRALVGLTLMASQAFLYNAIFFTYALILTDFYGVPGDRVAWYIVPFAIGNFTGPLLLGPLFDQLGRRVMIGGTYAISGVLLALSGIAFRAAWLDATTQTLAWTGVFFFASAAASSAYLTVSESFPLEMRAIAIAVFYAFGTAIGGVVAPWLLGRLIDTGSRTEVLGGYLGAALLMVAAAAVQWRWGVAAERRPLEEVAAPLAAIEGES